MGIFTNLFGTTKDQAQEPLDANYIETIINESDDEPFGVSERNIIYVGYNELGGYYFLQTLIVGAFKIKTKAGASLLIEGQDYTFDLDVDMPEFESEAATSFKGFVTKIDFEIDQATVEKIKKSTIDQLTLTVKNHKIIFSVYNSEG
ncbi:hypothetical protein N7U66_19390 [Lacinutrix neustonica]|uniref:Uncharacterized protein n=1 Tax=Lacinutrix neustonica TaxID=2980107 RepID=A0A9E8MUY7_9FLAO|nr:hypothetical protein [Lacinutrix neustonica]WAC01973.1 hypothetical protein N7U66_19390 [Lacinutrix neustonica]